MARPITFTKALAASGATKVCASQTLLAAGNLLINGTAASGGVATLDSQRRLLFTSGGDDHTTTWTAYGTNDTGNLVVDSGLLSSGATVASNLDFRTVTQITLSAAAASTISVGTNGVGSSPWAIFDYHLTPPYVGLVAQLVTGTGNMSVEYTADKILADSPQSAVGFGYSTPTPFATTVPGMSSLAATTEGAIDFTVTGWRMTINSGTGTWKVTGIQAGLTQ